MLRRMSELVLFSDSYIFSNVKEASFRPLRRLFPRIWNKPASAVRFSPRSREGHSLSFVGVPAHHPAGNAGSGKRGDPDAASAARPDLGGRWRDGRRSDEASRQSTLRISWGFRWPVETLQR